MASEPRRIGSRRSCSCHPCSERRSSEEGEFQDALGRLADDFVRMSPSIGQVGQGEAAAVAGIASDVLHADMMSAGAASWGAQRACVPNSPGTSPRLVAAACRGLLGSNRRHQRRTGLAGPVQPVQGALPLTEPRRPPAAQWPTSHTAKMPRCACAGTRIVPLSRQLTGAGDRFHSLFSPSFAFPVRPFAATTPALSVADAAPVMRCACVGP